MGTRYLIDSNVIIDYAANRLSVEAVNFLENLYDNDFIISAVTQIEILGYNDLPSKIKELEVFLNEAFIYHLDKDIVQQTILIRRKNKIKLGDAIIAATAIIHNFTILTRNTKDFEHIAITINPYNL